MKKMKRLDVYRTGLDIPVSFSHDDGSSDISQGCLTWALSAAEAHNELTKLGDVSAILCLGPYRVPARAVATVRVTEYEPSPTATTLWALPDGRLYMARPDEDENLLWPVEPIDWNTVEVPVEDRSTSEYTDLSADWCAEGQQPGVEPVFGWVYEESHAPSDFVSRRDLTLIATYTGYNGVTVDEPKLQTLPPAAQEQARRFIGTTREETATDG